MQSADHGPWTGVQASEELVGRRACRLQAPMALVLCAPAPAPVPGVLSLTPTRRRLCLAEVSKALPAAPASPRGQRGGRRRPSCQPRLAAPGRPATGLLPGHTSARSSASQGKQPEPAGTVTQCRGRPRPWAQLFTPTGSWCPPRGRWKETGHCSKCPPLPRTGRPEDISQRLA